MNDNHHDFVKYASNPTTWLFEASRHFSVWKVLSMHAEKLLLEGNYPVEEYSGCRKAALFHAGIAIENALKANLVRQESDIISGGTVDKSKFGNKSGHGLLELAKRVLPELSESEQRLLRKLEEHVMWAGKYSVPLKADRLYDRQVKSDLRLSLYGDNQILQELYNTIVCLASGTPSAHDTEPQ
jgi:hypothetical protein